MAALKITNARAASAQALPRSMGGPLGLSPAALAFGLLLLGCALAIYWPAVSAGFIWDDDQLLTRNPVMTDPQGWWKIWIAPQATDYFPLTSLTFWLEWRLWGLHAAGYHVTNILWHGLASVLMWRVLLALRIPGAGLAALLFAVHPVGAESVAWISERKNTLSQVLFLATLLFYLRFEKSRCWRMYALALGGFTLALLAKTSVVILPLVLLLCAWWQRGRVTRVDVWRAAPFFVIALLFGLVTVYFQYVYAIGEEIIPIGGARSRLANAGSAVWFYLGKIVWPRTLEAIYPTWNTAPPEWFEYLPGLALLGILTFCWWRRAEPWARAVLFGLGYFIIALLPVLGFLKMSYMRLTLVADHFQYLAMIGPIALIVAAARRWLSREMGWGLAALVLVMCGARSWAQASVYKNEETLWRDTLEKNEATWQGHNHLGSVLYQHRQKAAALPHFLRAAELKPGNPEVHNNLGLTYESFGQKAHAIEEFQKAVQLRNEVQFRLNLARVLTAVGRQEEALRQYRAIVETQPDDPVSYVQLGAALLQQRRTKAAIVHLQHALQLDPDLDLARQYLAAAFAQLEQKN